jgi:dolichol-phosphate mannosyltransferase
VTVTVLAPAYNEEAVIRSFVATVTGHLGAGWELLVVDDGSTDGTARILAEMSEQQPSLRVVTHPANRGIGAALRTGFAAATGDVTITTDADLSHPVELLDELAAGCDTADAVFASRYVPGGAMVGVPWWRRAVSVVANRMLRLAFRSPVRDLTTGFRAYRTDVVRTLPITGAGFEAQLEITVRLLAAGCHVDEIPLVLQRREAGESKMRYLRLVPRYTRTSLRMLMLRWLGR